MFRDVPECSRMFHVPGFIDAQNLRSMPSKASGKCCLVMFIFKIDSMLFEFGVPKDCSVC